MLVRLELTKGASVRTSNEREDGQTPCSVEKACKHIVTNGATADAISCHSSFPRMYCSSTGIMSRSFSTETLGEGYCVFRGLNRRLRGAFERRDRHKALHLMIFRYHKVFNAR